MKKVDEATGEEKLIWYTRRVQYFKRRMINKSDLNGMITVKMTPMGKENIQIQH